MENGIPAISLEDRLELIMTPLRDILLTSVVMAVPAYLVVRAGWRGVVVAVPFMWISAFLAGEIQRAGDLAGERFGLAVWIVIGWLVSLAYCGLIYGVRQLALFSTCRLGSSAATRVRYRR